MPCQLVEILARLRVKPKNPPDLSVGSVNGTCHSASAGCRYNLFCMPHGCDGLCQIPERDLRLLLWPEHQQWLQRLI